MLHFLASAYFIFLMGAAITIIVAMLSMNRALILGALGFEEIDTIAPLPVRTERPRPQARVIRMTSPVPALRMAA